MERKGCRTIAFYRAGLGRGGGVGRGLGVGVDLPPGVGVGVAVGVAVGVGVGVGDVQSLRRKTRSIIAPLNSLRGTKSLW